MPVVDQGHAEQQTHDGKEEQQVDRQEHRLHFIAQHLPSTNRHWTSKTNETQPSILLSIQISPNPKKRIETCT